MTILCMDLLSTGNAILMMLGILGAHMDTNDCYSGAAASSNLDQVYLRSLPMLLL